MSNPLKWRVDCQWPGKWWEPIAAFNCERAAVSYAEGCTDAQRANPEPLLYRVVTTRNRVVWP